jgi:hypothetical protein
VSPLLGQLSEIVTIHISLSLEKMAEKRKTAFLTSSVTKKCIEKPALIGNPVNPTEVQLRVVK